MGAVVSRLINLLEKIPTSPVDLTPLASVVDATTATTPNVENKSVEHLVEEARKKFGLDVTNDFNFAVVGQRGVGKSTLINALRHMEDEDLDAAPIEEAETSMEIKKYTHPKLPHVALWDVPGAGTLRQPHEIYFENNMLYAFDCILVLSADRFLQVDFDIAKKAMEFKRPMAFVRTKADLAVKSIARRKRTTMLEASKDLRLMVNESFQENLENFGLSPDSFPHKLYIVSAWAFTDETAYANKRDESLAKMDELELFEFLAESVRYRVA